jgi:hypothetical protein
VAFAQRLPPEKREESSIPAKGGRGEECSRRKGGAACWSGDFAHFDVGDVFGVEHPA